MNYRAHLRLLIVVVAFVALALIVLFPPWSIVRITPHGAVPLRVEFSSLLAGGPRPSSAGMYPQRSSLKVDWLIFEIGAVVVIAGLLLVLLPAGAEKRGRPSGRERASGAVAATPSGGERVSPTEFQSSPGEPFDQHAARLKRLWEETPAGPGGSGDAPATPNEGEAGLSAAPPVQGREGAAPPPVEFQSGLGEPFEQHAERLRRIWRQRREDGHGNGQEHEE